MKPLFRIFPLAVAGLWGAVSPTNAQINVTQEHNNLSRDGLYVDSAFTPSAAANMTRDMNFDGTISGNVYAQPLYIENGPAGAAMVIVVTESNNVYASRQVCRAATSVRSASLARLLSIWLPGPFSSMQ